MLSCAWWRYLVRSLYGTTNFGEWLLSLIIRTEVLDSRKKNWFKCFLKSAARWSSGSTLISSSESDDSRALMIFEKASSFICSAAIPRWLQILSVKWWRLSGMRRIRSWFACGSRCMSSGDKPQTVDLADTSRRDVDVKVGAFLGFACRG